MTSFHHEDERRVRLELTMGTERRLSPGRAILVIATLSALFWAVLIAVVWVFWSAL
jgi:hypothetical protein